MDNLVEIPKTQVIMAFVATCIETTARWLNTSYKDVYQRMKNVGLIEQYILPHYETLHTESRENLAQGLVECLDETANSSFSINLPDSNCTNYTGLDNRSAEQEIVRTEFNKDDDPVKSPVIQEIIMSNRIGAIVVELAKRLDIAPEKALQLFYESQTCADLHDKSTGLYLYGDLYVADEFMREKEYAI